MRTCPRCGGGLLFLEQEGKARVLKCILCSRSFDLAGNEIKPGVGMVKTGRPDVR